MIPSIWPETYSYTTDEAIASGYKVVAFKIGAHSDRIIKKNMGWIVEKIEAFLKGFDEDIDKYF